MHDVLCTVSCTTRIVQCTSRRTQSHRRIIIITKGHSLRKAKNLKKNEKLKAVAPTSKLKKERQKPGTKTPHHPTATSSSALANHPPPQSTHPGTGRGPPSLEACLQRVPRLPMSCMAVSIHGGLGLPLLSCRHPSPTCYSLCPPRSTCYSLTAPLLQPPYPLFFHPAPILHPARMPDVHPPYTLCTTHFTTNNNTQVGRVTSLYYYISIMRWEE